MRNYLINRLKEFLLADSKSPNVLGMFFPGGSRGYPPVYLGGFGQPIFLSVFLGLPIVVEVARYFVTSLF